MTREDILDEIEALPPAPPRRVVHAAVVGMVPSIIDAELAGVRARLAARLEAERQRVQAELARQAARAWWRAWEQRQSGKVTAIRRRFA
jgi:hypothetical protein